MGKIPWGAGRTRISKPPNMGFVTKRHNKGREKLSLFQLSSSSTGRRGSGRVSGLCYHVTWWWYTRVALWGWEDILGVVAEVCCCWYDRGAGARAFVCSPTYAMTSSAYRAAADDDHTGQLPFTFVLLRQCREKFNHCPHRVKPLHVLQRNKTCENTQTYQCYS